MRQLSNWLDAFLEYCYRKEPPVLFKTWVGIFTIAAVLERKCWLHWDKVLFPNLFVMLVGPAAARKGTAMAPGIEMLVPIDISGDIFLASNSGSMQGMFEQLNGCGKEIPNYPPEMNTSQMSSMTAFSEEFATLMGTNNLDYCMALTELYDCGHPRGRWEYRTKASGFFSIRGPWLNLIGAITPEMLPNVLPREVITGGLASRFMFVYGDERDCKKDYFPVDTPNDKRLLAILSSDLKHINKLTGEFKLTQEWVEAYTNWRIAADTNPPLRDHQFESYLGRRPMHFVKLCMVLSAARDDTMTLDMEIFHRANEILLETEIKMPRVYEGHGKAMWAQFVPTIVRMLYRQGAVSQSELSGQFYKDIPGVEMMNMLKQLINKKVIVAFVQDNRQWIRLYNKELDDVPTEATGGTETGGSDGSPVQGPSEVGKNMEHGGEGCNRGKAD